jgi:hypothetical protein
VQTANNELVALAWGGVLETPQHLQLFLQTLRTGLHLGATAELQFAQLVLGRGGREARREGEGKMRQPEAGRGRIGGEEGKEETHATPRHATPLTGLEEEEW